MPNQYAEALNRPIRDKTKVRKAKPHPSQSRSKIQEREIAANLVPRSGAGDIKGDVRIKRIVRIECKTTKNASFSVTLDMFRKIEEAALSGGELPCLVIEFNDGAGNKVCDLAVLPTYALNQLIRE